MSSLPQISATLGACTSTNKNINTPCIAHFSNLVAKPKFSQLALVGQNKSIRDLRKECQKEKWKAWCSDDGSCGVVPEFLPPPSITDIIKDFYKAFNAKDTQALEQLLSPHHCVYEDFLYYGSVEGKESIMNFWQNVMDAMGPSVRIAVDEIKDINHRTATVFCHLEWEEKKLPFTNECRFFTFEEIEGRMCISKITDMEELPLKPGELMLKLLKAIRMIFDRYPLPAKALLESHALEDASTHGGINLPFDLFGRKH